MPDIEFTTGAKTELWNATNGFPVMVLAILNALIEMGCEGPVTSETMHAACDRAYPTLRDKLDTLWLDCPPPCQDLLRRVQEQGELTRTGIPNAVLMFCSDGVSCARYLCLQQRILLLLPIKRRISP
jgi:hypothetical protein